MDVQIEKSTDSRISSVDFDNLIFGRIFSDHMLWADCIGGKWSPFKIRPFGSFTVHPTLSALHHGQSIFEGMKAYKNNKQEVLLFRPEDNFKRMNRSARRMCMPEIPQAIFMDGLLKLIDLDRQWVPSRHDTSLYIRPVYFATDEAIGVKPSENYRLVIFTSPVSAYYNKPLKLFVETKYSRSCEGGPGFAKAAGNYGGAMYPTFLAQQKGYDQVIWTDSSEHEYIEELGSMNIMFLINDILVTPSLSESKLDGITRDSILKLVASWGIKVEERQVGINELVEASKNGSLQDAFGCGTAANVIPVELFNFKGVEYNLPSVEQRSFFKKVYKGLLDIKTGEAEDAFSWTVKV